MVNSTVKMYIVRRSRTLLSPIFEPAHAEMIADFECSNKIVSAAFSPDGSLLAARSYDGVISMFDLAERKLGRSHLRAGIDQRICRSQLVVYEGKLNYFVSSTTSVVRATSVPVEESDA